ncbi:MAG: Hsp33 family molecular chaperone HslO [Clostridia bacterium]|nr:Hsp33 family molecular chaperone HslO [Clostridia bacterium]
MNDYMITGIDKGGNVSIKVIYAKDLVESARTSHNLSPTASACLGRTLIMTSMIGDTLKDDNAKCTVMIKGDGPIGGIVVTSDNAMRTKGYVYNPSIDIPLKPNGKLDVSGAIGMGTLSIIKDLGLKEPYSGMINLVSGEIAEDFTYYYTKSEQSPSAIGLGVLVDKDASIKTAGGFWISILPGCKDEVIDIIENNLKNVTSVTKEFEDNKTCEDLMKKLFNNLDYKIIEDSKKPLWYCDCSKDKIGEALASINKDELKQIIEEDGKAEITCHFCNKVYDFNKEELENIYNGGTK